MFTEGERTKPHLDNKVIFHLISFTAFEGVRHGIACTHYLLQFPLHFLFIPPFPHPSPKEIRELVEQHSLPLLRKLPEVFRFYCLNPKHLQEVNVIAVGPIVVL